MKKFTFVLVMVFSLILSSCKQSGTPTQTDGAKHDFDVQFLFEAEGVKVYRFWDAGEYIYFTNCNGTTSYNTSDKYSERKTSYNNRIENNDND